DSGVREEPVDVTRGEARHPSDLEVREPPAEVLALAEDRQPAQAALEALEADLLEERAIVARRNAPLRVVILDVGGITATPCAAHAPVWAAPQSAGDSCFTHVGLQSVNLSIRESAIVNLQSVDLQSAIC